MCKNDLKTILPLSMCKFLKQEKQNMTFNIEAYLNYLPNDIQEINVTYKKLTYLPNLSRFKNLKRLYCYGNQLTDLPVLNKNLEELSCYDNQLSSLPELNEKLKSLGCSGNKLTYLPKLNKNLEILICYDNQLSSLPELNKKLEILICSHNKLTYLPKLNENLEELFCHDNHLTSLPVLNENLTELDCSNNPICEIINHQFNIDKTKIKIKILNKFRYSYYSLKFKKRLRDWLWEKVRKPKIMRRYHPSYLIENLDLDLDLDIDIDLEQLLNNW
jgi:Leucine-rich repeat (LRR) protein